MTLSVLHKVVTLMLVSSLLAGANAFFNPHRPPWNPDAAGQGEIVLSDALALGEKIFWVDARSKTEYLAGTIPESLLLNEDSWEELLPSFLERWQPDITVVVFCSSQKCHASRDVTERLKREVGISNVFVLKGGWETWLK